MKSPRWGRCSGSSLMMLHSSYSVHYHNTLWRSKLANRRQWATSYYTKDVTATLQQYLDVKLNINKAGFFLSTLIFAQSFRLGFLLIHFFSAKKVRDNQLMKAKQEQLQIDCPLLIEHLRKLLRITHVRVLHKKCSFLFRNNKHNDTQRPSFETGREGER